MRSQQEELLEYNQHLNAFDTCGAYQFTNLGKISVKALALRDFNAVQEPLIRQKLAHFEAAIFDNKGCIIQNPELSFRLIDLRIYTAQIRKILLSTLYYLEVQADGQIFHKIGITTRSITQRLTEIKQDLRSHFKKITILVVGMWSSRENVERYFKYKYSDFNYPIGSLTEYFKFNKKEDYLAVKHDLDSMKPKVLSKVETEIFEGKVHSFEQVLGNQLWNQERSLPTQIHTNNRRIDRLTETKLAQVFLSRPSSVQIIEALHQGSSVQQAAITASVPIDVARNVLALLQRQPQYIKELDSPNFNSSIFTATSNERQN